MKTLLSHAARFVGAAVDLLAPPRCLVCGSAPLHAHGLCAACLARLADPPEQPCRRCAAPLGPGLLSSACPACVRLRPRFVAAAAGAPYSGLAGEMVRRAKYGRDRLLAVPLSALARRAAAQLDDAAWIDVVAPVPADPRRRRERGFDLAELLAADVAAALRKPLRTDWLLRVGATVPQASLTRAERRRAAAGTVAVRGAPSWRRRWGGRGRRRVAGRVLLVDDVLTTGSTANACTGALLASGADWVALVVAARA